MKIGIMTFWWSNDNYGQILQCYALQKYLRDIGHDVYLIRYDPRNDYVKISIFKKLFKALNLIKLFFYLKNIIIKILFHKRLEKLNEQRRFVKFRADYIQQSEKIYYSYNELLKNPPEADIYIVGSDQVWNHATINNSGNIFWLKSFFLDFGKPETIRIAYAASFSKTKVHNNIIKEISPLLKNFKYISVREKDGIHICEMCGINDAEWVPDPTMLLNVFVYSFLFRNIQANKFKKPYCLLYLIKQAGKLPVKEVLLWAKTRNINIYYVSANYHDDKYNKVYPTIPEWLYLISNAEYVITNSFHGTVFSLLFRKQFCVIKRKGNEAYLNNRIVSLFEILGIKHRFADVGFSILNDNIDWERVFNKFEKFHKDCALARIIA
jgi:hypothetical protein